MYWKKYEAIFYHKNAQGKIYAEPRIKEISIVKFVYNVL
jgi:hypothetical protein